MSTTEKSKIHKLIDLVDYHKTAIVSTQITKEENGNVTLFSFDKDQELSEHTAPFDALVYVLDGEVEIKISGNPFSLQAGEIIIMPANQPHAVRALTQFKMLLIMIKA